MSDSIQRAIDEIVEFISIHRVDEKGLVIQRDGHHQEHILNDLGDYLPFFNHLKKGQFCDTQVEELKRHLKDYLLEPRGKIGPCTVNTAYEHSDLILGLLDYGAYDMAEKILNQVLRKFKTLDVTSSLYLPSLKVRLPFFNTVDGMYIELLVTAHHLTQHPDHLSQAQTLATRMLAMPFFQKNHLFPDLHTTWPHWIFPASIRKRLQTVKTMKNNTNTLFALLELYRVNPSKGWKEAIEQWTTAMKHHAQSPQGGIYGHVEKTENGFRSGEIDLTSNFAVLDFLCDSFFILKNPAHLSFAREIADYWLKHQSPTTHLLPLYPERPAPDNALSYLDSETDMLIALRKLSELTDESRYAKAADRILEGILSYHRQEQGYALQVDIHSGEIKNPYVKTKFVTLLLKALILYDSPDRSIYSQPKLFELLKDR